MKNYSWIGYVSCVLLGALLCWLLLVKGCDKKADPEIVVVSGKAIHDTVKVLVDSSHARVFELNKKLTAKDKEIAKVNLDLKQSRVNEEILANVINESENSPSLSEVNDYIKQVQESNLAADKQAIAYEGKIRLLGQVIDEKDSLQAQTEILLDTCSKSLIKRENQVASQDKTITKAKQKNRLWKYISIAALAVGVYLGNAVLK